MVIGTSCNCSFHYMENRWVDGYMNVCSFIFKISSVILAKISSMVDEGIKIQRDKHP